MENNVVFYCFKNSTEDTEQDSKVLSCGLKQAHNLFSQEYAKKSSGICKWDYFDITVGGKLLRSSNR